ncbi:MAG TPA: immunoglobulin domain-containing protein [Verrucomicrobiae bacterium]|nr:immunoglobulin domain-containing protein [Verrucomicrobiae bacterium]
MLEWNPSPDPTVVGYYAYYGSSSGTYTNRTDAGPATNAPVTGLLSGATYFFAVTAYDSSGLESLPSAEVSYTVPAQTNTAQAPSITIQPVSETNVAGSSASFQVVASGSAPLTYQWQFNGSAVAGATDTTFSLTNVQPSQAGAYWVVVSNTAGSITSAVAQLTVLVAPSITVQPADQSVLAGSSATFQVSATGTAPLAYQWLYNGNGIAGAGSASLVLPNVQPSQAGAYSVIITNFAGAITSSVAQLSVQVPFTPPTVVLSQPTNGASFNAPAVIPLQADITPNGNSISNVQFFANSNLIGQLATAPYSLNWSNVAAGDYSLTAIAWCAGGSNAASAPVQIHVAGLLAPWETMAIGSAALQGTANIAGNVFSVDGAGSLSGYADSFQFLYQPISGNGSIVARVVSDQNSTSAGRAGVMIRETLTSNAAYAFMGIGTNGQFRFQRRRSTAGSTRTFTFTTTSFPNAWVRVTRSGTTFTGYSSVDGTNWTQVYSGTVTMAANAYIGLAVVSGASNRLSQVSFDSVVVVP